MVSLDHALDFFSILLQKKLLLENGMLKLKVCNQLILYMLIIKTQDLHTPSHLKSSGKRVQDIYGLVMCSVRTRSLGRSCHEMGICRCCELGKSCCLCMCKHASMGTSEEVQCGKKVSLLTV